MPWRRSRPNKASSSVPGPSSSPAPTGQPGEFYERLTIRVARSLLRPKVAHRAYADVIVLHEGQHDVTVGTDLEDAWQRVRPPGRPVLRPVRQEGPGRGG